MAVYPQKYLALVDAQGDDGAAVAADVAPAPPSAHRSARLASAGMAARHAVYRVQRGDTLDRIAERHGVSVAVLKRANRLRSSRILEGQLLHIPVVG